MANRTKTATDTSDLDDKLKDLRFSGDIPADQSFATTTTDSDQQRNYLKENPKVGDRISNNGETYTIIQNLAVTEEAQSYIAEDEDGNKKVLKVMDVPKTILASDFEKMIDEIYLQVNAALDRNNEVFVLNDFKVAATSDYVDGFNLDEELKRRKKVFSEEETIHFLLNVLQGDLKKVHKQMLVHRDIKPKNVIRQQDAEGSYSYNLIDFGIMREHDASMTMTRSHRASATFTKIKEGINYECADDFYSLSRTAYVLLRGRYPAFVEFGEEEMCEELDRKQFNALPASDGLKRILLKMQGYDGGYRSCEEVVGELNMKPKEVRQACLEINQEEQEILLHEKVNLVTVVVENAKACGYGFLIGLTSGSVARFALDIDTRGISYFTCSGLGATAAIDYLGYQKSKDLRKELRDDVGFFMGHTIGYVLWSFF